MVNNVTSLNSYAIDFGTSNTVITRWNASKAQAVVVRIPDFCQQIANVPPLIPSLVYLQNASTEQALIGQQVRDLGLDLANDPRFFRGFKRGIGTDIQGFLPKLDGKTLSFEYIGKLYLQKLITQLKEQAKDSIKSLVVTVPVDSFEVYRLWLTDICLSLDIEQIRIIDEPTAAALGYSVENQKLLLVVDFGGGTIDLSLIQLEETTASNPGFILKWGERLLGENTAQKPKLAKVIAKVGQNLGGADIDNWLVDYFAEKQNLPKSSLTTRLAERLKIKLSSQNEAAEAYFDDENLQSYDLSLNQETFTEMLSSHEFFSQLDELMNKILQQARRNGVEITNIDNILLVGGSVQIPQVQAWVKNYFPVTKIICDRPLTAVAEGALQVAQGIEIKDFLYHSYGIRYWNSREKRHSWHPLIKSGQPYPMAQSVSITLGASVANQPCIELIIGELSNETVATEVYFDGDRLITRNLESDLAQVKPLNDSDGSRTLAVLDPLGNPGSDRIELRFQVDDRCFLRVTVEDLLTEAILLDSQIIAQLK
ncbi:Molecular chaperone [Hyella patelloides LEGE 07179]|uniref:Molecular chaperone n=1 Tax=Hyella patelloides LEGE 07179 TaxID=945734 RepID=A0A563W5I3_9CYAN|nr:Hsp70 family protein [Hyella patelloides]VEP18959.1 Molecular chaperone [Hyella patelloides LEGE 07179]